MSYSRGRRVGVVDAGAEAKVLLLGDAAAGKTSLLQAYVTGRFPADGTTPPALDPVRLTPAANATAASLLPDGGRALLSVNMTVVDTESSATARAPADVARAVASAQADAVVLCYPADEPAALVRVVTHWLAGVSSPAAGAARPHWPFTPVCLCGTKEDMFDTDADAAWGSAYAQIVECVRQSDVASSDAQLSLEEQLPAGTPADEARRASLEAVLLSFPFVMGSIQLSVREPADGGGGVLAEVGELLQQVGRPCVRGGGGAHPHPPLLSASLHTPPTRSHHTRWPPCWSSPASRCTCLSITSRRPILAR